MNERRGVETCGWRRWTRGAVGIGELRFPLHTGVNAMLRRFLLSGSDLDLTVFALFSGFAVAMSPAQGSTAGV